MIPSVAVVILYVVVPLEGEVRVALGHALLTAAPLLAVWSCVRAGCGVEGAARVPWWFLAAAALIVAVGQAIWAVQQLVLGRPIGYPSLPYILFLLFHPCYAAGAALALRPARARGNGLEIALDGALIAVAALVLVDRFVFGPVVARGVGALQFVTIASGQLAAVVSVLFAGLLVLWGDPMLPRRSVPMVVGAAVVFLLGNILVVAGADPRPDVPGDAFDLVWLAGWGLLVLGGVEGRRGMPVGGAVLARDVAQRRLRQAVVPGAALFLGAAAMDAVLSPVNRPVLAVACGLLGLLLAARVTFTLRAADRQAEERRQLAHTRALVEVSRALAGATELSRTLELVAQWACHLLDARAAGIELLTDDGTALEMRAVYGLSSSVLGLRFPVEGSFTGWVVSHGRARATLDPSADPYVQPQSLEFIGSLPVAAAPLHFGDRKLGALFASNRERPFDAADLELLCALADQAALAIENAQLFEQVHTLSLTDPLTGLANRRQLERDLAREIAAARRGRSLMLVLFDLDNFKSYNDRYGHLAGDEVLRRFGRVLGIETRAMNLAARYGGDEFLVLLTESTREGAETFIKRVSEQFRHEMVRLGRGQVTVSAGLAVYSPDMESAEDLIAAADRGLYRVKAGRGVRSDD
ncbi:MAG TPA: sensor domain-containing diguanylate cyclase [Longimicrobiales bacterium]